MSKISDELRAAANMLFLSGSNGYNVLMDLADRIDAEMVELPKDADGVPIHVGDTVYMSNGRKVHVSRVNIARDHTSIDSGPCGNGPLFFAIEPTRFTHTAPDSWERIADELDEQAGSLTKDGYTWQEDAIHDFADRIRKLAKEQGE